MKVVEYDISVKFDKEEKWRISSKYGAKRKSKLWVDVFMKSNKGNKINSTTLAINNEIKEIVHVQYNDKVVKHLSKVDIHLVNLILEEVNNFINKFYK